MACPHVSNDGRGHAGFGSPLPLPTPRALATRNERSGVDERPEWNFPKERWLGTPPRRAGITRHTYEERVTLPSGRCDQWYFAYGQ
ncbi:hypothetical protein GCM10027444_22790 [Actinopolyspora lacussalsi]